MWLAGGRVPRAPVDRQPHALALAQLAVLERDRDRLVVSDPVDVLDPARARLGLDEPGVRDLAPALGVERGSRGTSPAACRSRARAAPTLLLPSVVS